MGKLGAVLILLYICTCNFVLAHQTSDSYLHLTINDDSIDAQWDIAMRDLDNVIQLDDNFDTQITWQEVRNHRAELEELVYGSLRFGQLSSRCGTDFQRIMLNQHHDGLYVVLKFRVLCKAFINKIRLHYDLLFDLDALHKGLVNLSWPSGASDTYIFSAKNQTAYFSNDSKTGLTQFGQFLQLGIWHIWIGFDHILFLLCLLLPAARRFQRNTESTYIQNHFQNYRPFIYDSIKLISAFTLAHSITLSLAIFKLIELPGNLVEAAIALSIILIAVNNIIPIVKAHKWWLVFGLGLIHGFGFASVLTDLGLEKQSIAVSLVGFNVGVEIGQLIIILLLMPLVIGLNGKFFQNKLVPVSSGLIAVIGTFLLVERI